MRKEKKLAYKIILAVVYIFLYAPLLVMVFFSFNASKSTAVFTGFSLRWYRELFSRSDITEALRNTLVLAVLSSIIATVIGTVAAYGIFKIRNRLTSGLYMGVTNIPMMNPDIVTGGKNS